MSESKIQWTQQTWNPAPGCSKVSEGCKNCYAEKMSKRLQAMGQEKYAGTVDERGRWTGQVKLHEPSLLVPLKRRTPTMWFVNSMSDLFHENLEDKELAAIFAAMAMCHEPTGKMRKNHDGSSTAVMQQRHVFQVLTKRPARMLDFMTRLVAGITGDYEAHMLKLDGLVQQIKRPDANVVVETQEPSELVRWFNHCSTVFSSWMGHAFPMNAPLGAQMWVEDGMPGLWLGVSVENQAAADERIPLLLQTPAAVRFLSCEPLIGPVDIERWLKDPEIQLNLNNNGASVGPVNWVIGGGESGKGARPMHPAWVRSLRNQCSVAGVPFFFKQWGEWLPWFEFNDAKIEDDMEISRFDALIWNPESKRWEEHDEWNDDSDDNYSGERQVMGRVGKSKSGNRFEGRRHEEFPTALQQWPGFKNFTTKDTKKSDVKQ